MESHRRQLRFAGDGRRVGRSVPSPRANGGAPATVGTPAVAGSGQLPIVADDYSQPVGLGFDINFWGSTANEVFVNQNGALTLGSGLTGSDEPGPLSQIGPIIAPFFADVDTRTLPVWGPGPNQGDKGSSAVSYGPATFGGRRAFRVAWDGVGYHFRHSTKTNKFSVTLVDRSDVGPKKGSEGVFAGMASGR